MKVNPNKSQTTENNFHPKASKFHYRISRPTKTVSPALLFFSKLIEPRKDQVKWRVAAVILLDLTEIIFLFSY